MVEKYLMLDLNNEKSIKIAEVLSNKTCKKILNLLSDKELTQTEISNNLKINMNTLDYNITKLLDSGLIEQSNKYFWSVKGKKIKTYRLANKKIVISTKSSFIPLISSVFCGGLLFSVFNYFKWRVDNSKVISDSIAFNSGLQERASDLAYSIGSNNALVETSNFFSVNVLLWFIWGCLFGYVLFYLNKRLKGGF